MENKFNYKQFAKDLKSEAINHLPSDLSSDSKKYIEKKLYDNVVKLAKGFESENLSIVNDIEKYRFACKVIFDWTFRKSTDLINSPVPQNCYDYVLDSISYIIYETLKNFLDRGISQDYILNKLEVDVQLEYKRCIKELEVQGVISAEEMDEILKQNNFQLRINQETETGGFDYTAFAKDLQNQARLLVPTDFDKEAKDYLVCKLYENTVKFAKLFEEENSSVVEDEEQYTFACQIIAEWTFHKTVDLLRVSIPLKYCDVVLERINSVIYKSLKELFENNESKENILHKTEINVKIEYQKCIETLFKQNLISHEVETAALKQDNLTQIIKESGEIPAFEIEEFIKNKYFELEKQIPDDLADKKEYILNYVSEYTSKFAKSLIEKFETNISNDEYTFACNELANWIFIKAIDLLRLEVPDVNLEHILDTLGFIIYEIIDQEFNGNWDTATVFELTRFFKKNINLSAISEKIKYKINRTYKYRLDQLCSLGIIDNEKIESAANNLMQNLNSDYANNLSSADSSNFNENRYLKDKILRSYAESLTYKYLVKAGHVLKKNKYKNQDIHLILSSLRYAFLTVIWKIDLYDEVELNINQVENTITVCAEIAFQRIVVLHKLNMLELDFVDTAIDNLVRNAFNNEIIGIKTDMKCPAPMDYDSTRFWAHKDFKDYFKYYFDNGNITQAQYKSLLDKSKLIYLMPTIKKMEKASSKAVFKSKRFWIWWSILFFIYLCIKYYIKYKI